MNIKYYLRGFGIGVIFATIVMIFAFSIDENINTNNKASSSGNASSGEALEQSADNNETTLESDTTKETETTMDNETDATTIENETTTEISTQMVTETYTEIVTKEEPTTDSPVIGNESGDTVTLNIKSGMISNAVAAELESLGAVDSGYEFNMYLYNNGYESKVRTGTYEIKKGASYEEIARIITGR